MCEKIWASDVITMMSLQTDNLITFQKMKFSAGIRSASPVEPAEGPQHLANHGDSKAGLRKTKAPGAVRN